MWMFVCAVSCRWHVPCWLDWFLDLNRVFFTSIEELPKRKFLTKFQHHNSSYIWDWELFLDKNKPCFNSISMGRFSKTCPCKDPGDQVWSMKFHYWTWSPGALQEKTRHILQTCPIIPRAIRYKNNFCTDIAYYQLNQIFTSKNRQITITS
jgi:hypothetical protein